MPERSSQKCQAVIRRLNSQAERGLETELKSVAKDRISHVSVMKPTKSSGHPGAGASRLAKTSMYCQDGSSGLHGDGSFCARDSSRPHPPLCTYLVTWLFTCVLYNKVEIAGAMLS